MKHKGSSARGGLLHEFGILVGCNLAVGSNGRSGKIGPSCWEFTQGGVSILTICSWGLTVHLLGTLVWCAGKKKKKPFEKNNFVFLSCCWDIVRCDNPSHTQSLDIRIKTQMEDITPSSHFSILGAPFKVTAYREACEKLVTSAQGLHE